ncbi:MAG: hypothetical protein HGA96_05965 [Desulfobulbaceae bacterium]|nr:hypothetical protein [Desulfobulbaceae bacterium]
MTVKLSGVSFGDRQANIKRFGCQDTPYYSLTREPGNPHDPNAIKVSIANWELGFIPKVLAAELAVQMDRGRHFMAEFVELNQYPGYEWVGITVRIVEVE